MDSHFKFWITNKGTFRRGLQCPLFCTLDLGLPRWVPYIVNLQTRIKQQGRKCKYILLGSDTLLVNKNYKQINTDRSWLLFSLLGNRVKITLKYCTFCLLYFLINCISNLFPYELQESIPIWQSVCFRPQALFLGTVCSACFYKESPWFVTFRIQWNGLIDERTKYNLRCTCTYTCQS